MKKMARKLLLCLVLEVGAYSGMKISLEEIERLMKMTSETQVTCVMRDDQGDGNNDDFRMMAP